MAKILYLITQPESGGAQRYVFDLAENLKHNHEVAVAAGERIAKTELAGGIKYFSLPHLKRNISPLNDLLALREITSVIKRFRPDIVHLNSSKISILGSIAARLAKTNIVYTAHGWVFNEPLPLFLKRFYLGAEKLTAKFKDKIICVSEYDRQTALKYKIAPAEKLITIHNGLAAVNFFAKAEAKKILNSKFSSSDPLADGLTANFLVGSIGNLYPTKGFEYFIQAAALLTNDPALAGKNFKFFIIGEGGERHRLENLIRQTGLTEKFFLPGGIDGAAKLLPAFDLYVSSSVKEGLPYSILEAMRAGLPIVAAGVGGIPEMVKDKQTALLVKPADARELAEKIKMILNNKILGEKLGQNASLRVEQEFRLEKMIGQTEMEYRKFFPLDNRF